MAGGVEEVGEDRVVAKFILIVEFLHNHIKDPSNGRARIGTPICGDRSILKSYD